MKRFAANRIVLSRNYSKTNAVVELLDNGVVHRFESITVDADWHSTPFYNGLILPFDREEIIQSLTVESAITNVDELMDRLFGDEETVVVNHLSLLQSKPLLTEGKIGGDVSVVQLL
mgnify:FL=1